MTTILLILTLIPLVAVAAVAVLILLSLRIDRILEMSFHDWTAADAEGEALDVTSETR